MSVLRVYLPAEPAGAGWRWALCSDQGAVLREGGGDEPPPSADDCELVLAAGLCRFAEPSLPPGAARQGESVLGFALEDGLLNAPEENRYSLSGGKVPQVCLTAQGPLRRIVASLTEAGQSVTRIIPEELCLPEPPADGWTVARLDSGWGLRLTVARALCVPLQGDVLWHALRTWASPAQVLLCGDAPLPSALQDLPVTHRPRPDWRTAVVADPAYDFAAGRRRWRQFGRQWQRIARQAGVALLALALFDLALSVGELGWLRWQQWRLTENMTEVAARMGLHPGVGEDVLNLARHRLAAERTRHGLAQDGDFLPMLVALQPVLAEQGTLRRLRYGHGELTLEGEALPAEVSPEQRRRLAAHGWSIGIPAQGQVTLVFAPTRRAEARP